MSSPYATEHNQSHVFHSLVLLLPALKAPKGSDTMMATAVPVASPSLGNTNRADAVNFGCPALPLGKS